MDLKQEIQNALTAAMKSKDEDTKRTLRLVISSIKLAEIEVGGDIDEARIMSLLQKEVKTRQDTIAESKKADRQDLADKAAKELEILNQFLPQQISLDELKIVAKKVIQETEAKGIQDMGNVMKHLMPRLLGRASGQEASKVVRDLLENA